ncbi:MAG: TetR/AcrR family transcriptional regulator [Pseudomonadota bacterium]
MASNHSQSPNRSHERSVRSRNAEATRTAFLEEGEKLFAQFGFEGVSLEQLANAVGGNKTLVSYHFKSKSGLYEAVIGNIVTQVISSVSQRLSRNNDAVGTFGAYVEALVFSFADKPAFCAILMREYISGKMSKHDDAFQYVVKFYRLTNELYRDGLNQKKFKTIDPHLLHFSIVGPIIHFIVSTKFRQDSLAAVAPDISNPSLEEFAAHHVKMILDGLVIDP